MKVTRITPHSGRVAANARRVRTLALHWALVLLLALACSERAIAGPFSSASMIPKEMLEAAAQPSTPVSQVGAQAVGSIIDLNPLAMLDDAAQLLPGSGNASPASGSGGSDLSSSGVPSQKRGLSATINILLLLTVISLAPSIVLMTTCFMRILIVLGFLKQAIGAQSIPPPQVTTALALFMTAFVMTPTVERVYNEAIVPYRNGDISDYDVMWNKCKQPLRDFMFAQIEARTTGPVFIPCSNTAASTPAAPKTSLAPKSTCPRSSRALCFRSLSRRS